MKDKAKLLIMLAVSGVATGLSVAFSKQLGFLIWFSMIPLFFALKLLTDRENLKLRHAYLYGLFYFECFGAVCFHFFIFLYPPYFFNLLLSNTCRTKNAFYFNKFIIFVYISLTTCACFNWTIYINVSVIIYIPCATFKSTFSS